jgi:hypothetical protein
VKPHDPANVLRRAAGRARLRPEFLGWVFARYEDNEGMQEEGLREHLGVAAADWPRLQLCLKPRADAFLQDVTQIAREFAINRAALAAVVRRVESVEVLRTREKPGGKGSLLAARTRRPKHPRPQSETSSDERPGT